MTKCTVGLDKTPDNNRKDFARLCKAYKEYVDENNIGALLQDVGLISLPRLEHLFVACLLC